MVRAFLQQTVTTTHTVFGVLAAVFAIVVVFESQCSYEGLMTIRATTKTATSFHSCLLVVAATFSSMSGRCCYTYVCGGGGRRCRRENRLATGRRGSSRPRVTASPTTALLRDASAVACFRSSSSGCSMSRRLVRRWVQRMTPATIAAALIVLQRSQCGLAVLFVESITSSVAADLVESITSSAGFVSRTRCESIRHGTTTTMSIALALTLAASTVTGIGAAAFVFRGGRGDAVATAVSS